LTTKNGRARRAAQDKEDDTAEIDARKLTTRDLNTSIKELISKGRKKQTIEILNPDARHNMAVGIVHPCRITFQGSVGYYCSSYCDGVDVTIEGNAGWGLGDNLMSGRIAVLGDSGASTGASMRGGAIIVNGNAGARLGISMKGGELIVTGNSGFLTGFMMQKGRVIVLGNVGDAGGDSMYEGIVYFGGRVDSLGADAIVEAVSPEEYREVSDSLEKNRIPNRLVPRTLRKIVSSKKLYHYDSLEPLERDRLVI
jgi:methylamine---glutamate N-methyltransferase subunit B